jgi:hypothetical protein
VSQGAAGRMSTTSINARCYNKKDSSHLRREWDESFQSRLPVPGPLDSLRVLLGGVQDSQQLGWFRVQWTETELR